MAIIVVIGTLIAVITAIGLLLRIDAVDQFFKMHQWAYVILALCLVAFSYVLYSNQAQEKMAERMKGTLEPVSSGLLETIFSTKNNINPIMEIGQSGTKFPWAGPNGKPMFVLPEDQYIAISKKDGQIKLSAKLRGKDGTVAEIIDNDWKLNPQNFFDRNYNESVIEIRDNPTKDMPEGDIILQIKVLIDRIQFQGKFYDGKGNGVAFIQRGDAGNGAMMERFQNQSKYKITPIFKYPSSKFFGKAVS